MKVDKFKKMSKGRYKITLSDLNEFILYEEVIFKHELLLKKDINAERLHNIYYLLKIIMKERCLKVILI